MTITYDVAIIGGGFFGASIAAFLAGQGKKVVILERDKDLMQRASYVNQARAHGGYHYPRSLLTALRSRVNLPDFTDEYRDCIDDSFAKYYAIGNNLSKVSADQFRLFSERIGAPIERAPASVRSLFEPHLIDDVFLVEEYAFDAVKIKHKLRQKLADAGVFCLFGASAKRVSRPNGKIHLRYAQNGTEHELLASQVLNCTYAHLNEVNNNSGISAIPLKFEVAEIALIKPPAELKGRGLTVMCGPFFSAMPFPSRDLYSFTHVRYTPHTEWTEGSMEGGVTPYDYLDSLSMTTAYPKMLADATRYMPSMKNSEYVESLYEVKTVLPQSEGDDSRPILFRENHGMEGYTCIMGGKLDNIYDVFKELTV